LGHRLEKILHEFAKGTGRLTVLTGAGISAESNIPTFRGPEGYWTIGSKEYQPQEMATYQMFAQKPDEVWKWYLYREKSIFTRGAEQQTGILHPAARRQSIAGHGPVL
jgi:NAD-dependent deacetylase